MLEALWLDPLALLVAIVVVMVIAFGIYWLVNGRGKLGAGMIAAGALLVVIPVVSIVWWNAWGSKQHSMSVQALDPATDPVFTVKINHDAHVISDEYYDVYPFDGAGEIKDVVATFQAQHPEGVPTIPDTLPTQDEVSLWHMSQNDIRFDLFGGPEGNYFNLVTQVASVIRPEDKVAVGRVPYPTAHGGAVLIADTQVGGDVVSLDELTKFYTEIPDATVVGGTITLPMDTGGTLTLTFDETGETYFATIDD